MSEEDERYVSTELNNNSRHYSNLRFAMFTVYFAVIGALASVSFGFVQAGPSIENININRIAKWAALAVTAVFFWFEILCTLNLKYFKDVATKELSNHYQQVSRRLTFRHLRAHYATWSLYSLIIVFWIYQLINGA